MGTSGQDAKFQVAKSDSLAQLTITTEMEAKKITAINDNKSYGVTGIPTNRIGIPSTNGKSRTN